MTLPYRKKPIEVGLPLAAINAESAREKLTQVRLCLPERLLARFFSTFLMR